MKKLFTLAIAALILVPSLVFGAGGRGVNFRDLPTPAATYDTQSFWCPDCTATAVCGGSGTGAFAVSKSSVWNCSAAGGAAFNGGSISSGVTVNSSQFLDNFTRANTALGTLGTADSGQLWAVSGPNVANVQVLNHAITAVLGTSQFYATPAVALTGNVVQMGARILWVAGSGSNTQTVELIGSSGTGGFFNQVLHTVNNGLANSPPAITWWNGVSQGNAEQNCTGSPLSAWEAVAVGDTDIIALTYTGSGHVFYQETYPDGTMATEDCYDPNNGTVWGNNPSPIWEAGGQAGAAIVPTFIQTWASIAASVTGGPTSSTASTTALAGNYSGGLTGPIGTNGQMSVGYFSGLAVGTNTPQAGEAVIQGTFNNSTILPNLLVDNSGFATAPILLFRNTNGGASLGCIDWTFDKTTTTAPLQICSTNARILTFTRNGVEGGQMDNSLNWKFEGPSIQVSGHIINNQTTFSGNSGCGASGVTRAGTDNNGQITIGSSPGTCVITFQLAYTTAPSANPICISNSSGTMTVLPCTATNTTLTLNPGGTPVINTNDVLTWVQLTGK